MSRFASVSVFLLLLACTAQAQPASRPNEALSSDGVPIYYTVAGSGSSALVFVHGWTLDGSFWDAQLRHFARSHQAVAIDLAGHGRSGTDRAEWTMGAFGADVVAVADELALDRLVLVGHSMGGTVALEAAREMGDRVVGVVLVDAFHDPDEVMADDQREGLLAEFRADFRQNVRRMARQYLFAPGTDSVLADRIAEHMASFDPEIGLAAIEELYRSESRDVLGSVDQPKVAINSDLYPTNRDAMRKYGVDIITMAGVGHFPMVENPSAFNQALEQAVARLR